MKEETEKLLAAMNDELKKTVSATLDITGVAWRSLIVVMKHLVLYKKHFARFDFGDTQNQIYFYKNVQPAYLQELFYFFDLLSLESAAMQQPVTERQAYYRQQLDRMSRYIGQHVFFKTYLAENKTHLDDILFTQASVEMPVYPTGDDYRDGELFNFNSFIVAKIAGYERLTTYLQSGSHRTDLSMPVEMSQSDLPFTSIFLAALKEDYEVGCLYEEMKRKMIWLQSAPQDNTKALIAIVREQKRAKLNMWHALLNRCPQRRDPQR